MQSEQNPRTTRDALIIELLGDLGMVHDEIKSLPENIKKSLGESLTIIANSIQEAEDTAKRISDETRIALQAVGDTELLAMKHEIAKQVQITLDDQLGNELNKCVGIVGNIRNTLAQFPDSFRPSFPIWPFVIFGVVIAGMAIGMFAMYQNNDAVLHNNMKIYSIYERQQNVIRTLPPEVQQKFK